MRYLSSSARDAFCRYGDAAYSGPKGMRVMKSRDGKPLPPGSRDIAFLVDHGLTKPRAHMTADEMAAALPAGGIAEAAPITLYSQRASEGCFPMTAAKGSNPHAKTSTFSAPMAQGIPAHEGGMDHSGQRREHRMPGLLRQGAGSELSVREAMRSLRARLTERFGPSGIVRVQAAFDAMDTSGDGSLSQEELASGMRRLGIPMPGREFAQLFSWFDSDRSGSVSCSELVEALRGTAVPVGASLGATRAAASSLSTTARSAGVAGQEACAGAWGLDTIKVSHTPGASELAKDRAKARAALVAHAWQAVAGSASAVPRDAVMAAFSPHGYSAVSTGRMSPETAVREVSRAVDIERRASTGRTVSDGKVTWEEFAGLHRSLSACTEDDEAFAGAVCAMWGVSPPSEGPASGSEAGMLAGGAGSVRFADEVGSAASTAALSSRMAGARPSDGAMRTVEVTHHDGSVDVVRVADRVGFTDADEPAIRARLRRDGVRNVHSVRLLD